MSVLHSSEFSDYVYALDPRITYDAHNIDMLNYDFGYSITGTNSALQVESRKENTTFTGKMEYNWSITRETASSVNITNNGISEIVDLTFSGNISNAVKLSDTNLYFYITGSNVPSTRWDIQYIAKPNIDLGSVTSGLKKSHTRFEYDIFSGGSEEPFKTFLNMSKVDDLVISLSGFLLGYIYQADKIVGGK